MNESLLTSIRESASKQTTVRELPKFESNLVIGELSDRFINDRNALYWWEALKGRLVIYDYGTTDGTHILMETLGNDCAASQLLVTDDSPEPWPVFEGPPKALIQIVREQHFFEYIITNVLHTWLICDTHHNQLVAAGAICDVASHVFEKAKQNMST